MSRILKRRALWSAAAAAMTVAAIAVAGCGGDDTRGGGEQAAGYGGATPATAESSPAPAGNRAGVASVGLGDTKLGKLLVDGGGRTLYLWKADKGTASVCDGACATAWPPLTTVGKPTAAAGVSAAKLGTTKRGDGATAVTYNGHPLYTFSGDSGPGQTSGQESDAFGAEWYVVATAGNAIESGK